MSPRGPELIGDASPPVGFIPWQSPLTEVCTVCWGLVPAEFQQSHMDYHRTPAAADDKPCTSLYYRELDRKLYACNRSPDLHKQSGSGPPGDMWHSWTAPAPDTQTGKYLRIPWTDEMAVPVPWPKDQEPPVGINLVEDTGATYQGAMRYLHRAEKGWTWSAYRSLIEDPYGESWARAVVPALADLRVLFKGPR